MAKSVVEHVLFHCSKVKEEVNLILNYEYQEQGKVVYTSLDCERKSSCGVYPNTKRTILKYIWYVCPACKIFETDIKQNSNLGNNIN